MKSGPGFGKSGNSASKKSIVSLSTMYTQKTAQPRQSTLTTGGKRTVAQNRSSISKEMPYKLPRRNTE